MSPKESSRIKTHIINLDNQMSGGIPEGHIVLISGNPGTYKSSLAYNILYHNALKEERKGLYISFQQNRESLQDQFESLNMPHEWVQEKITIVDVCYLRDTMKKNPKNWMDVFKDYVKRIRSTTKYELLVVDSLTTLELISGVSNRREDLFHLFEWLRDFEDLTSLLIVEKPLTDESLREEEFLADGIIYLTKERVGRVESRRYLSIDKMRATKHNTSFFTLLFDGSRLQVTRVISE
ncbi:MAG: ATPase domain-containing protein [Thermoplasmata archaeon]